MLEVTDYRRQCKLTGGRNPGTDGGGLGAADTIDCSQPRCPGIRFVIDSSPRGRKAPVLV